MTPEGQEGGADDPPGEGWVQVPGAVVVSEKTEHIVNSHQVAENRREEEEVTHCGDVTNQVSVLFTLAPLWNCAPYCTVRKYRSDDDCRNSRYYPRYS